MEKVKTGITLTLLILSAIVFWISYPITMTIICLIMLMISFSGVVVEYFTNKKE